MEIKYISIYIYYFVIKMLTLMLKYPYPPPPFLPYRWIISQFFAYSSHAKPLNSFSNFKICQIFQFGKFFKEIVCRKLSFLRIFTSNLNLFILFNIWNHIHLDTCIHVLYIHTVFILRMVYHIRFIVNYKQNQVFSINTLTKHLHVIARENNVSVLVPVI